MAVSYVSKMMQLILLPTYIARIKPNLEKQIVVTFNNTQVMEINFLFHNNESIIIYLCNTSCDQFYSSITVAYLSYKY